MVLVPVSFWFVIKARLAGRLGRGSFAQDDSDGAAKGDEGSERSRSGSAPPFHHFHPSKAGSLLLFQQSWKWKMAH